MILDLWLLSEIMLKKNEKGLMMITKRFKKKFINYLATTRLHNSMEFILVIPMSLVKLKWIDSVIILSPTRVNLR